jgi:hypothetical protein
VTTALTLGLLLACAAVAVATVAGWLLAAIAARGLSACRNLAAPTRAVLLAQARLLPLAAVALLVPTQILAFAAYEAGGVESAGPLLLSLGLAGLMLGLGAARRGLVSWRDTSRIVGTWKRSGSELSIAEWPGPVWAIGARFPIVAVVGAVRPQLFVARQVVESCTKGELTAIVAHEAAHVAARDNLVRLLFHLTPGSGLFARIADPLERDWLAAAEEAADLSAGRSSGSLELASALTKVARLAAPAAHGMIPASTLISDTDLPSRVRRLLQPPPRTPRHRAAWLPAALALAITAVAQLPPIALRVHELFELLVRRG